ncbi:MAG: hypothetical protein KBB37_13780 [Bacteroidia bacterium]|jgi:hypothetical protein|nr:hypothetical protein [Bacteroidia bacterium]MBP7262350.1 hypothetical protein [Bacteroidia bacterium]MBP9181281.1 hypothetical protein [Bacteroidia bacterium]MBP9725648.1 hypothetical protein [Bacteroidia bacterium]
MKLFVLLFTFCTLPFLSLAQNEFNFCGHTKSISYAELKKCPRLAIGNDSIYKITFFTISYHLYGLDYSEVHTNGIIKQETIATFERHKVKSFTIENARVNAKGFDTNYVKMKRVTIELTPTILIPLNK